MILNKHKRVHIKRPKHKINIISYESSKWYIKLWRTRWYIYAIFLHFINYIDIKIIFHYFLKKEFEDDYKDDKKILYNKWITIKKHIELSKMYKFSTRIPRND